MSKGGESEVQSKEKFFEILYHLKKNSYICTLHFNSVFIPFFNPMIVIHLKENETLDKALKRFKKKFEKTGVLKELRRRTYFEKKSVELRNEKQRASYIQKLRDDGTIV
jgi:small subunit ribosomal protein S21